MIRITSGTVRTSKGLKTSKDKPFTLPPEEEQRFIDRNVAKRVYAQEALPPVATDRCAENKADTSETLPPEKEGVDVNGEPARLDAEQLKTMKMGELKLLAEDMGVDVTGLRSKDEVIAAITAVEVFIEPELSVEEPVE